jgi:hypothetical protein
MSLPVVLVLVLVLVLIVGIPVFIVSAMVLSYEDVSSRVWSVVDTLLFHPISIPALLAFVAMVGGIVFYGDWGLGLESPVDADWLLSSPRAEDWLWYIIIPISGILSFGYLLFVRPGDVKPTLDLQLRDDPFLYRAVEPLADVLLWIADRIRTWWDPENRNSNL